MNRVFPATPAVLVQRDPFWIVSSVLLCRIVAFAAYRTGQRYDHAGVAFPSHISPPSGAGRPSRDPAELLSVTSVHYLMMFVTTPAPTVRPPSRIAKRRPSSIAIGTISSIFICVLSPGITISTPSARFTDPVTSVVLK